MAPSVMCPQRGSWVCAGFQSERSLHSGNRVASLDASIYLRDSTRLLSALRSDNGVLAYLDGKNLYAYTLRVKLQTEANCKKVCGSARTFFLYWNDVADLRDRKRHLASKELHREKSLVSTDMP